VIEFTVRSVVDKGANRNALHQLRHAAHVIVVIVGNEHGIDAAQACALCCGNDAVGIAKVVAGPAGINQQ
jgi:hypothetical protein